jgi:hypothetical protein
MAVNIGVRKSFDEEIPVVIDTYDSYLHIGHRGYLL